GRERRGDPPPPAEADRLRGAAVPGPRRQKGDSGPSRPLELAQEGRGRCPGRGRTRRDGGSLPRPRQARRGRPPGARGAAGVPEGLCPAAPAREKEPGRARDRALAGGAPLVGAGAGDRPAMLQAPAVGRRGGGRRPRPLRLLVTLADPRL
ncbi:MAG: hypothetical protein AVDCRST_MAG13-1293, partial [uncultured Solirubrobacteraceae bacterium]